MVVVPINPLVVVALPGNNVGGVVHFVLFLAADCVVLVMFGGLYLNFFTSLAGWAGYGSVWKR